MTRPHDVVRKAVRFRHHALAAWLLAAGATGAMAEPRQVAEGGGPWCGTLAALQPYVAALLAGDTAALSALPDCRWLDAGSVVDVLEEGGRLGGGPTVARVRLTEGGGRVGYTIGSVLEAFHGPNRLLGGRH